MPTPTITGTGCLEFIAKLLGGLTAESLMNTIKVSWSGSDATDTDANVELSTTGGIYAITEVTIAETVGHPFIGLDYQNTELIPTVAINVEFNSYGESGSGKLIVYVEFG